MRLGLGLGLSRRRGPPAGDTTPNAFTFTDVTDADPETVYESNAIIVAGINAAAALTITGGQYQIDGGAWASTPTTVTNGASVKVRGTSSADPETAVNVVLTIGGVSDTFTITTAAEGGGAPELLADINFQAGTYTVGGNNVAVADQFATDVGDGTVWDAGDIIPGSGLRGSGQGGISMPSIVGALRTAIINGMLGSTLRVDYTVSSSDDNSLIDIEIYNSPSFDPVTFIAVDSVNAVVQATVASNPAGTVGVSGVTEAADAVNVLLATLSPTYLAAQHGSGGDPLDVVPDPVPDWLTIDGVAMYRNGFKHMRRIRVYSPVEIADYPGLLA